jgi:RNA polymerase sigma-70 factor, ECF subfamily
LADREIIEQCIKGDFVNFRELVRSTSQMIYPMVFRMTGEEKTAEDIVQETMIKVWEKIGKLRNAGVYRSWVYRIALNKCYDCLRQRKNNPVLPADDALWKSLSLRIADNSPDLVANSETILIISRLSEYLSPKQKSVFILSDLEDMTHDEISEITGMNKNAVKSNLHFARKSIAEKIEKLL